MKVADIEHEHAKRKWSVASIDLLRETPWRDLESHEQYAYCGLFTLRFLAIWAILFFYICSLAQISTAFSLIGSRGLGTLIKDSPLIHDPISALILGMVATVVLQSPTTTTTILVSMVAANMITVHTAIPVMIGSELGSSLVNSFVSLAYSGNDEQFRRAFAAATLGDIFNICSLSILLPVELCTKLIEKTSWLIVDPLVSEQGMTFKTLDALTDPFNQLILQVNEAQLREATINPHSFPENHTFVYRCLPDIECPYFHLFARTQLGDSAIGWIVLVGSLIVLILSLCGIVYLTQAMLAGRAAIIVRRLLDKECPAPYTCCTGYLVMAVGLIVTVLVQSNSIFSSSLTPLVGIGVISLEKMYPLTLGSNIGTTFTGVIAAMASDGTRFESTLHMAMCQVLYNVFGTLLFYVVPCTRRIPLFLARRLGTTTAQYRWFIFVYIVGLFILLPAVIFLLSLGPDSLVIVFVIISVAFTAAVLLINYLQLKHPKTLPEILKSWEFLPRPFRSMKYWDVFCTRCFQKVPIIGKFVKHEKPKDSTSTMSEQHTPQFDRVIKIIQNTSV